MDEFAAVEDGYGFLIETAVRAGAGGLGAAVPTRAPAQGDDGAGALRRHVHRPAARARARRVEIDGDGQAVPYYDLTDELDVRNTPRDRRQARLHAAAGAEIQPMAANDALARWGRPRRVDRALAARAAAGRRLPALLRPPDGHVPDGQRPDSSVADPWGQLHDTKGVWIGDGSAFPTASGTNPMISIMALAHRTAEAIATDRSGRPARQKPRQLRLKRRFEWR